MVGSIIILTIAAEAFLAFLTWTLVRDKVIFAELKKPKAKLTEAQQKWHDAINASDNGIAYAWRPEDWDEIEEVLK